MLEMSMVPPNLLGHAWKKSEHLIGKLKRVSHGRFEGHDILHEMYSGKQQMWCIWEGDKEDFPIIGVVITEVLQYPQKKLLCIQYCTGARLNEWKSDILDLLDRWAKECECDGLELTGRKGWVRELKPDGWNEEYVILTKYFDGPETHIAFDRPQLELVDGLEVANG